MDFLTGVLLLAGGYAIRIAHEIMGGNDNERI